MRVRLWLEEPWVEDEDWVEVLRVLACFKEGGVVVQAQALEGVLA